MTNPKWSANQGDLLNELTYVLSNYPEVEKLHIK